MDRKIHWILLAFLAAVADFVGIPAASAARVARDSATRSTVGVVSECTEELRFPPEVTTIDGASLDVSALAMETTIVVVTVKDATCPVCRQQLERIGRRRAELAECGVSFLVLGPGPAGKLAQLREAAGFDHPFIADEELRIARELDLVLGPGELVPAILMLDPDLRVGWMQRGRSSRFFGDPALIEKVRCWEKMRVQRESGTERTSVRGSETGTHGAEARALTVPRADKMTGRQES
jgi:peroxiredoxin